MRHGFRLDPPVVLAYLALGVAACTPGLGRLTPGSVAPATLEQVQAWVSATTPRDHVMHRFKWLFQDERSSAGGRGIARIAGPDSLRFDVAGPLGAGKASAVVIGDSARWVDADKSILDLVPNYPLLWAMLGVARPPGPDSELRGLEDENKVSWLYANGADTVEYRRLAGNPMRLQAEARHAGKVVGRTEISFSADGVPLKARLLVPRVPAKLDLTFYASTRNPEFAPDLWLPRQH